MKKLSFEKLRRVEVDWRDSASMDGWSARATYEQEGVPALCRSIGYLLNSTEAHVLLVQNLGIGLGEHVSASISIPRSCIVKMRTLQGGLPR